MRRYIIDFLAVIVNVAVTCALLSNARAAGCLAPRAALAEVGDCNGHGTSQVVLSSTVKIVYPLDATKDYWVSIIDDRVCRITDFDKIKAADIELRLIDSSNVSNQIAIQLRQFLARNEEYDVFVVGNDSKTRPLSLGVREGDFELVFYPRKPKAPQAIPYSSLPIYKRTLPDGTLEIEKRL